MYKHKSLHTGQPPQEHLSFLQNLLSFIITKYFKQELDDSLSICVNERSSCGLSNWRYENLSKSRDQKAMTLLTPMGSAIWASIKELFLLPKFDNNSPCNSR